MNDTPAERELIVCPECGDVWLRGQPGHDLGHCVRFLKTALRQAFEVLTKDTAELSALREEVERLRGKVKLLESGLFGGPTARGRGISGD